MLFVALCESDRSVLRPDLYRGNGQSLAVERRVGLL
jgi:hypothetical protein